MSDIIFHNIDEQPEEGSAYLHSTPPEEERNEAIEFAEWITYQGYDSFQIAIQIKWSKGKYQPDFTTKELYELFKTRNQ